MFFYLIFVHISDFNCHQHGIYIMVAKGYKFNLFTSIELRFYIQQ